MKPVGCHVFDMKPSQHFFDLKLAFREKILMRWKQPEIANILHDKNTTMKLKLFEICEINEYKYALNPIYFILYKI